MSCTCASTKACSIRYCGCHAAQIIVTGIAMRTSSTISLLPARDQQAAPSSASATHARRTMRALSLSTGTWRIWQQTAQSRVPPWPPISNQAKSECPPLLEKKSAPIERNANSKPALTRLLYAIHVAKHAVRALTFSATHAITAGHKLGFFSYDHPWSCSQ